MPHMDTVKSSQCHRCCPAVQNLPCLTQFITNKHLHHHHKINLPYYYNLTQRIPQAFTNFHFLFRYSWYIIDNPFDVHDVLNVQSHIHHFSIPLAASELGAVTFFAFISLPPLFPLLCFSFLRFFCHCPGFLGNSFHFCYFESFSHYSICILSFTMLNYRKGMFFRYHTSHVVLTTI